MRITEVTATPLLVPYARPFHWAHGVIHGASVVLIEVHTDAGVVGYGESIGSPAPEAIVEYVRCAAEICVGRDPFENRRLMTEAYDSLFRALGTCSAPHFGGQVLAGVEMALWDAMGKAVDRPVHDLLGGAVRDEIEYFGFPQGETASEVAADAARIVAEGFTVVYFKVGRGDELDLETAAAVRSAIGPGRRMRVDANEHWAPDHAARMIGRLAEFDVEMVEQPTHGESLQALAQVRAASPVAIAADQVVFTPHEAYEVCRQGAADLIVIGVHETGGLARLAAVAQIAEAAGINICLHGLYETGITTCASRAIAATIPNLDDANQHMTRFLSYDLVRTPDLAPLEGRLSVGSEPGLGFELDPSAVERARANYVESRQR
jgi:L-alanine-DL-glutamate epimerase-like enolase superfamily enzyme